MHPPVVNCRDFLRHGKGHKVAEADHAEGDAEEGEGRALGFEAAGVGLSLR